jgi:hypothetical protein
MSLKWLFSVLVTLAMALGIRPATQERKLSPT